MFDYVIFVVHLGLGYSDFVSDIFSFVALYGAGQFYLMAANIAFSAFNILLNVLLITESKEKEEQEKNSWKCTVERFLTVVQLQQLVEAYRIIFVDKGKLSAEYNFSKKVDAITRSLPSTTLQLYSIFIIGRSDPSIFTLTVSVGLAIASSAFTLANLSPKSGSRIFSSKFIINFVYFAIEILVKCLTFGLFFAALYSYGN